jgi:hypothetical protein
MSHRFLAAAGVPAAVILVVSFAVPAIGQAPPRTPWGEPDLQGVWRNETLTDLERPAAFAGKEFLTDEEAAALVQKEAQRSTPEGPSTPSARQPTGTYNNFWQYTGQPARVHRRTSLIVDPRDGKIPFTPEAKLKSDREDARYGKGPYNSWLDIDTGERCITDGLPGAVWTGTAGGPQQIRQSPGYVMIMGEQFHDRRVVPTDGRPHGKIRSWLGEGVGRWDGNTLVVETINFLEKAGDRWVAPWRASTETMRLTERFTRVSDDTIEYRMTIEDPAKFTRPWTVEVPLTKLDQPFFEYACHEGNYGIIHTLSGERAQESGAAGKTEPK